MGRCVQWVMMRLLYFERSLVGGSVVVRLIDLVVDGNIYVAEMWRIRWG